MIQSLFRKRWIYFMWQSTACGWMDCLPLNFELFVELRSSYFVSQSLPQFCCCNCKFVDNTYHVLWLCNTQFSIIYALWFKDYLPSNLQVFFFLIPCFCQSGGGDAKSPSVTGSRSCFFRSYPRHDGDGQWLFHLLQQYLHKYLNVDKFRSFWLI